MDELRVGGFLERLLEVELRVESLQGLFLLCLLLFLLYLLGHARLLLRLFFLLLLGQLLLLLSLFLFFLLVELLDKAFVCFCIISPLP